MRYHIDTIPVWDALHENEGCLLCFLREKTERLLVERSLGASVMSPEARALVMEGGFCARHQLMLYHSPDGNRLGHALMTLSRLRAVRPKVEQLMSATGQTGKKNNKGVFTSLLKKIPTRTPSQKRQTEPEITTACVLCENLETQGKQQAASLLHLWKSDAGFRAAFRKSKGMCVPDTAHLHSMAQETLSGETLKDFKSAILSALQSNLTSLEKDLEWFTLKSDYRNADKPWGDSKTALERTINTLEGWCLNSESRQGEHIEYEI